MGITKNKQSLENISESVRTHRTNKGKITICSVDTVGSENPVLGFSWNKFSRETFTFKLPGIELKNEIKPKRT